MTEQALNPSTREWVDDVLDPQLNALILSARKTGWAECLSEVTRLLVATARHDDAKLIFKELMRGLDDLQKKGFSLHA